MTFNQLCATYSVTEEERSRLLEFLVFIRFRDLMEWWDKMEGS